jgi:hypothetical protein
MQRRLNKTIERAIISNQGVKIFEKSECLNAQK